MLTSNVWFRVYRNETTTLEERDYNPLPEEEDVGAEEDNSTQNMEDQTTENYTISL